MLTGQAKVDYQREYMRKWREKRAVERASVGGGKRKRPFKPKGLERVRSNGANNQKPDAYIRNDVRPKAVRIYGMNAQRALDYMIELNKAGFTLTPGPPYRMMNMKTGKVLDYAVVLDGREPAGV